MTILFGGTPPRQDLIIVSGYRSPGLAVVKNAAIASAWDVQKGYGLSGAYTIFTGTDLSKFDVEITMTDDDDWDAWDVFAKLLERPPSGTRPKAYDIEHPVLNMSPLRIKSAVVLEVSQWDQDELGFFRCTIKFLEFRAPKLAIGAPKRAIPAISKPTPTIEDQLDAKIAQETVELVAVAK